MSDVDFSRRALLMASTAVGGLRGPAGTASPIADVLGGNAGYAVSQRAATAALANKVGLDLSNLAPVDTPLPGDRTYYPMGNPSPTKTRFALSGTGKWAGEREFMVSFGMNCQVGGQGDPSYQWDKVTLYYVMQAGGTVMQAWAGNSLLELQAKTDGKQFNFGSIHEFDINAKTGHDFNATSGDLSAPSMYGVHINGAGTNIVTAGYGVLTSRANGAPLVQYGYMVGPGATRQADFYTVSAANIGWWDRGQHTVGIELTARGGYTEAALRVGNGQSISSWGPGDAGKYRMLNLDSNADLHLGDSSTGRYIITESTIRPLADNVASHGTSIYRYTTGYFANGVSTSSDPSLKNIDGKIGDLDLDAAFEVVDPIYGSWKEGGQRLVEQQVERTVQATETVTGTRPVVEMVDGKPVERAEPFSDEVPIYDPTPVVDEAGVPVMEPVRQPRLDANGNPVTQAVPTPKRDDDGNVLLDDGGAPVMTTTDVPVMETVQRQKTHLVPRMVTQMVPEQVPESVPGKRTHCWISADDAAKVANALGLPDFGGYVLAEDGSKFVRMDQFVPILWAAAKQLRARTKVAEDALTALSKRVAALESKTLPPAASA